LREGWELVLNELGLSEEDNKNAKLDILLKLDGSLRKAARTKVVEIIRDILGTDDEFTIIKPPCLGCSTESKNCRPFFDFQYKTINLSDIGYLVERWKIDGGDWLVILPGRFIPHIEDINYYDEDFVGHYLTLYRSILVKSPDGYDLMHIYIEGDKQK
jgi:hypothetical protein